MMDLCVFLSRDLELENGSAHFREWQIRETGILREEQAGRGRKPAILCFPRLINLMEDMVDLMFCGVPVSNKLPCGVRFGFHTPQSRRGFLHCEDQYQRRWDAGNWL